MDVDPPSGGASGEAAAASSAPSSSNSNKLKRKAPPSPEHERDKIMDQLEGELTECDREPVHLIGAIQGDSGNCLYMSYPAGTIVAVDQKILDVPFIQLPSETSSTDASKGSSKSSEPAMDMIGVPLRSVIPMDLYSNVQISISGMIKS